MTPTLSYLLLFLFNTDESISHTIHCFNAEGDFVSSDAGLQSTASCPSAYTLLSCGMTQNGSVKYTGSFIRNDQCLGYGAKSESGGYIQVHARCCNLTDYGSPFQFYESTTYFEVDDDPLYQSCGSDNEELVACAGYKHVLDETDDDPKYFDGFSAGNRDDWDYVDTSLDTYDKCVTVNGYTASADGYSGAMCYDKSTMDNGYDIECVSRWGDRTYYRDDDTSRASCPENDEYDWFITSCTAQTRWGCITSHLVEGDECIATDSCSPDYYTKVNAVWFVKYLFFLYLF